MSRPTDRCHELITSRPFQALAFVVERTHGHRNVRARQPGTRARPAKRGLPARNAGDDLAPTPAQAEATAWPANERCTPGTAADSALRRRPFWGRRPHAGRGAVRTQAGTPFGRWADGESRGHTLKWPGCAQAQNPVGPALSWTFTSGRDGSRPCAGFHRRGEKPLPT